MAMSTPAPLFSSRICRPTGTSPAGSRTWLGAGPAGFRRAAGSGSSANTFWIPSTGTSARSAGRWQSRIPQSACWSSTRTELGSCSISPVRQGGTGGPDSGRLGTFPTRAPPTRRVLPARLPITARSRSSAIGQGPHGATCSRRDLQTEPLPSGPEPEPRLVDRRMPLPCAGAGDHQDARHVLLLLPAPAPTTPTSQPRSRLRWPVAVGGRCRRRAPGRRRRGEAARVASGSRPCAVDPDVGLDVRCRLPDGGNIHAEELGAALQRRGDRPGSGCRHRAIHVRFREHAPSSRPMPGRKAPAPADVLQVLVTCGPARPRSRGGPTWRAGTRPSPGRRSRSGPSPPG